MSRVHMMEQKNGGTPTKLQKSDTVGNSSPKRNEALKITMKKIAHKFVNSLTVACLCLGANSIPQTINLQAADPQITFQPLVDDVMISEPIVLGDVHRLGRIGLAVSEGGRIFTAWSAIGSGSRVFSFLLDENFTLQDQEHSICCGGWYVKYVYPYQDGFLVRLV